MKLPTFNTPVLLEWSTDGKLEWSTDGKGKNRGLLLCSIYQIEKSFLSYTCLAAKDGPRPQGWDLWDLWDLSNPRGSLPTQVLESWKEVPTEDLPLYIGYPFIWPAFSQIIKEASFISPNTTQFSV